MGMALRVNSGTDGITARRVSAEESTPSGNTHHAPPTRGLTLTQIIIGCAGRVDGFCAGARLILWEGQLAAAKFAQYSAQWLEKLQ